MSRGAADTTTWVTHATGPRQVIAIGVPSFGRVSLAWAARFADLRMPMNVIGRKFFVTGTDVGTARNQIAAMACAIAGTGPGELRCTHLLFLDDDVLFHQDLLVRLLSHGRPIVSGLYYTKTDISQPLMFAAEHHGVATGWRHGELVTGVSAHGMGLCLISADLLRALSALAPLDANGYPDLFTTSRDAVVEGGILNETEDVAFCRRARAHGVDLAVDTGPQAFGWHVDLSSLQGYPRAQFDAFASGAPIVWPDGVTW